MPGSDGGSTTTKNPLSQVYRTEAHKTIEHDAFSSCTPAVRYSRAAPFLYHSCDRIVRRTLHVRRKITTWRISLPQPEDKFFFPNLIWTNSSRQVLRGATQKNAMNYPDLFQQHLGALCKVCLVLSRVQQYLQTHPTWQRSCGVEHIRDNSDMKLIIHVIIKDTNEHVNMQFEPCMTLCCPNSRSNGNL